MDMALSKKRVQYIQDNLLRVKKMDGEYSEISIMIQFMKVNLKMTSCMDFVQKPTIKSVNMEFIGMELKTLSIISLPIKILQFPKLEYIKWVS